MALKPRMTEQLSALVTPDMYNRIAALAEKWGVSNGAVVREALERGLPSVEAEYAGTGMRHPLQA